MRHSLVILPSIMLIALVAMSVSAVAGGVPATAGYQYLRDADGDGIPNCEDPDYVPPRDGTGYKSGKARMATSTSTGRYVFRYRWNWIMPLGLGLWTPDLDGSGGSGYGPGDGTGNGGVGPADGTGYGPGPYGPGTCTGGRR